MGRKRKRRPGWKPKQDHHHETERKEGLKMMMMMMLMIMMARCQPSLSHLDAIDRRKGDIDHEFSNWDYPLRVKVNVNGAVPIQ